MSTYDNINSAAVVENEYLMASILESDYNVDASLGTVIRELAVRPNAVLAAYNDERLAEFKASMTLSTAADNANVSDEDVDALASNFRLVRLDGRTGAGVLSIYTDQTSNVYIGRDTVFSVAGVDMLLSRVYIGYINDTPAENTEDVWYRRMVKTADGSYMFTVPVSTREATEQTLGAGMTVTMNPSDSKVTKTLVASAVMGGSAEETNSELLARAGTGITANVPSGKQHIDALIARDIPDVNLYSSAVFGMSDPEVLRDQYNISGLSMGGRVDVYARTSPLVAEIEITKTATLGADGKWSVQISASDAPGFYGASAISPVITENAIAQAGSLVYTFGMDTTDTLMPDIPEAVYARFSQYQTAYVTFNYDVNGAVAGDTKDFVITLSYMPSIDIIQTYMNQRDTANSAQDTLVKAPIASSVSVQAAVTHPPGVNGTDIDVLKEAVATTINSLSIGQRYLTADEICLAINGVDATLRVDFPVVLSASTFLVDGSTKETRSTSGHLDMYTDEEQGITERNTCFFCNADDVDITITERVTES
jgi:hypothetical protein